jgi:hypothetical protein
VTLQAAQTELRYHFHVNLFARPDAASVGQPIELRGSTLPTLRAADGGPLTFDAFLPLSFEQALDALARLPRLDAEPDGFFVLAGGQGPTHWAVSGQLFDYDGRLHRVELNGRCPAESFDALLACFNWPATPLAFELVEEGVALEEAAFRAFAGR